MTVHITYLAATGRIWGDDARGYGSRYDASFVLQWETPKAVSLSTFTVNHGAEVSRKMLREVVAELDKLGIERIRSTREHGRLMPLGTLMPDGTFVHVVSELLTYLEQTERRHHPPDTKPPSSPQRRRGEPEWKDTVPMVTGSRELENLTHGDLPKTEVVIVGAPQKRATDVEPDEPGA